MADLSRVSQGSTFAAVSKADLAGLEVPLPSPGEQRKIAAILSSVDDTIEKTQAVIDQIQVVKRGLMQELLARGLPGRHTHFKQTEIGEIPEQWDVVEMAIPSRRWREVNSPIARGMNPVFMVGSTPSFRREMWQPAMDP